MVQKKIVDYRVVTCSDKKKFEESVMTMINKYGYELSGSMSNYNGLWGTVFCQPMVLCEADEFVNLGGEAAESERSEP